MNIARLVKALEKAGVEVKKIDRNEYKKAIGHYTEDFIVYECKSSTHKCTIYPNGRLNDGTLNESCYSVQVMRRNESNDSQSDYFPGWFAKTIKSVVQGMTEK